MAFICAYGTLALALISRKVRLVFQRTARNTHGSFGVALPSASTTLQPASNFCNMATASSSFDSQRLTTCGISTSMVIVWTTRARRLRRNTPSPFPQSATGPATVLTTPPSSGSTRGTGPSPIESGKVARWCAGVAGFGVTKTPVVGSRASVRASNAEWHNRVRLHEILGGRAIGDRISKTRPAAPG